MQKTALAIDDLTLQAGDREVLNGFSLQLEAAGRLSLTGRSGCGKSTLLRALLGFVPPIRGSIRIFDQELTEDSCWQLRTRMAYVDQEPDLGEGTVDAFLARQFQYRHNRHLRYNLSRLPELFDRLLLPASLGSKELPTLSGGEKQRLALIAALLLERDILLLDEATAALDSEAAGAVFDLLDNYRQTTILAVVHDPFRAAAFGRIVDLGRPQRGEAG